MYDFILSAYLVWLCSHGNTNVGIGIVFHLLPFLVNRFRLTGSYFKLVMICVVGEWHKFMIMKSEAAINSISIMSGVWFDQHKIAKFFNEKFNQPLCLLFTLRQQSTHVTCGCGSRIPTRNGWQHTTIMSALDVDKNFVHKKMHVYE